MSAKDYKICPACFNAYIAKVSKRNPNLMTDDRRAITEGEILTLIDWFLDIHTEEGEHGVAFDSSMREGYEVVLEFKRKEKKNESNNQY